MRAPHGLRIRNMENPRASPRGGFSRFIYMRCPPPFPRSRRSSRRVSTLRSRSTANLATLRFWTRGELSLGICVIITFSLTPGFALPTRPRHSFARSWPAY